MPKYRFYSLDHHGSITGPSEAVDLADQKTATAHAETLTNACAVEVWSGGRRIALIKVDRKGGPLIGLRRWPRARDGARAGGRDPASTSSHPLPHP